MRTSTSAVNGRMWLACCCAQVILLLSLCSAAVAELPRADELRCDGMRGPLAVSSAHPRLSWQMRAPVGVRGEMQDRLRVVVGVDKDVVARGRGSVWDSGEVAQHGPAVALGAALQPGTAYWWSVRLWDQHGVASAWSQPVRFRTASTNWRAAWVQAPFSTERDGAELDGSHPMPMFQRAFSLDRQPVEAYLSIAGLGQYEAALNGEHVGPAALGQAWTDYRKTITYDTYDVSAQLHRGHNVIRVLLGNGMFNVQRTRGRYTKFEGSFGVPKLIAELNVRYADGQSETIATDTSWQAAPGPVLFSSTYGGEDFDARRESADAEVQWQAVVASSSPGGALVPAIAPLVVEHEHYQGRLTPHQSALPGAAGRVAVYDFGQNSAGRPRIVVHGTAGSVVRLVPGELLHADGTVSQRSSGGPQWWSYTLRGRGDEVWEPHFSYYGFRYVQVEWTSGSGVVKRIDSVAMHSSSEEAGEFASSNEMLNRIHRLILAAIHNNEVSLFTDCPHREKLGWLEQVHLMAPGLLYNDDVALLYRMTARNIADAQDAAGMVPTIAPQYTKFGPKYAVYDDSPEWGSAAVLAAWAAYRQSGDRDALENNYPVMQRYVEYLNSRAKDGIVAYGLGDWYDVGVLPPGFSQNTSLGVTGTLMLYEDARAMAGIATLLGKDDDAMRYTELAASEQAAFARRFFHPQSGSYDTGSQTANAMPLALGIVPASDRAVVLQHLIDDIREHQDHVTTGEVGFPYLVRALMENGRSDVLLALLLKTDPPSYGSQLAAGATSLTEAWDANPRNSQDHFMLGAAEEWFYRGLAGIDVDFSRTDEATRITLRPLLVQGVSWTRGSYRTPFGAVGCEWHVDGRRLTMDVSVPTGTTATAIVPSAEDDVVLEGGRALERSAGIHAWRREQNAVVVQLGSGTYRFVSTLPGR